jgi:putative transcriptional regulator
MSAGGSRNDDAADGAFEFGGTTMKNRIRVLRAEKGWSQAELAEHVDVSRNSINAVENGKFDPSLPLAFRIADAFGLRIEDVFIRDEK